MDEASVEQAIKDKLLIDERLLKRLIKAKSQPTESSSGVEMVEEFRGHAEKIESFTKAAMGDVEYFESERVVLRDEQGELQAQIARMHATLQVEKEHQPQYEELQKLHLHLREMGEKDSLAADIEREEEEIEKIKFLIQEEEERIRELKSRLEKFLDQFRTNE